MSRQIPYYAVRVDAVRGRAMVIFEPDEIDDPFLEWFDATSREALRQFIGRSALPTFRADIIHAIDQLLLDAVTQGKIRLVLGQMWVAC